MEVAGPSRHYGDVPTRVFLAAVLLSFPALSLSTEPAPTNRPYKVERYTVKVPMDMKALGEPRDGGT